MKTESRSHSSQFVHLQNEQFLLNQRIAGKVAAGTISLLEKLVKEKTNLSMIGLDRIAEDFIRENNCIPTFKGYKGFPATVCISINEQLVHGIPTNRKLIDGDVVKFDLGATFNGVIADTAATFIYGEPKDGNHIYMIDTCKKALKNAIAAIKIGSRIGVIGNAIYKTARNNGFVVIERFGGHGISITKNNIGIPHSQPFIPNRSNPSEGVRIQKGMVIAIEPLLTTKDNSTSIGSDNWTVSTKNVSVHQEHSLYIHEDYVEIITKRE
jgi:methionyl aminopeptidase